MPDPTIQGKLWHRVFVASAAAVLAAVAVLLLAQQWVFTRNFVDYINQRDREAADKLVEVLRGEYRTFGWNRLRDRPHAFNELVELTVPEFSDRPPPPPRPRDGRPPSRRGGDDKGELDPRSHQRPPAGRRPPSASPPRFALMDAQRASVSGTPMPPADAEWIAIDVDEEVVGYVVILSRPGMRDQVDLAFAQTQQRSAAMAAGLVLLLMLPASWWWSRRLAAPLARLAERARRVGAGDYATRMDLQRNDELGALGQSFDRMAEALQQGRTARQRWTAEISHELRTPVAILRAEIEAMQDGVRPTDGSTLKSLASEVDRLSALIDDLYQLASADAGALNQELRTLDLVGLLQEAIQAQSSAFQQAELRAQMELPDALNVHADARQLRQLIDNLLVNALRYVPAPGTIRIQLVEHKQSVDLIVEDDGPGVADDQLHRLFDPLYRADASRSREHGGAGLGLALVQRLAQAHGASAEASRSPLGGLRILIRGLPR
ncbi:ATP-binding protein [Pseudomarimonas arenosa]|uniref:histidine kinase n=1 Tax=Pseudomarimonas arenosa TaxID=2774145 RepID=A0AAW3ZHY7_9GAMM|nr:ATP-binding protein [Pseudomarimonas arenosa]MBD8524597.1 HAMP domain-containing protein [Pseudomarimonas arenosa]